MLTYIIPTRDRPEQLAITLRALAEIDHSDAMRVFDGVEVIIADNASRFPTTAPQRLPNGIPVRVIYRASNEAAAARNAAALAAADKGDAANHWLLMLDDDSAPLDAGFVDALIGAPPDVAAVGAEIVLPSGIRELGGLPEVFIGCGVAIRRSAFLDAGGYDPSFVYYAEEYDLAAKFLLAGLRIIHDRRFRILHRKTLEGRDMNLMLRHLTRNNACIAQRYAPEGIREAEIGITLDRSRRIAGKEGAMEGFRLGLIEWESVRDSQPRREMPAGLYDRFTGLAAARECLRESLDGFRCVSIIERGKHAHLIEQVIRDLGLELVDEDRAEALVIGTLSPGPMLDALDQRGEDGRRAIPAWNLMKHERAAIRAA